MINVIQDISTLTTIPKATLNKLTDLLEASVCHAVQESCCEDEEITSINLGYGVLHIKHSKNELKYKFIPSNKFEKAIVETVKTKQSPLVAKVEETLTARVMNVYKELL